MKKQYLKENASLPRTMTQNNLDFYFQSLGSNCELELQDLSSEEKRDLLNQFQNYIHNCKTFSIVTGAITEKGFQDLFQPFIKKKLEKLRVLILGNIETNFKTNLCSIIRKYPNLRDKVYIDKGFIEFEEQADLISDKYIILKQKSSTIRFTPSIHSKIFHFEFSNYSNTYIGSLNITHNALIGLNAEAGVWYKMNKLSQYNPIQDYIYNLQDSCEKIKCDGKNVNLLPTKFTLIIHALKEVDLPEPSIKETILFEISETSKYSLSILKDYIYSPVLLLLYNKEEDARNLDILEAEIHFCQIASFNDVEKGGKSGEKTRYYLNYGSPNKIPKFQQFMGESQFNPVGLQIKLKFAKQSDFPKLTKIINNYFSGFLEQFLTHAIFKGKKKKFYDKIEVDPIPRTPDTYKILNRKKVRTFYTFGEIISTINPEIKYKLSKNRDFITPPPMIDLEIELVEILRDMKERFVLYFYEVIIPH